MRLSQLLRSLTLSITVTAATTTNNYSTWMADSIISRGQGIAPETPTASTYLQIGIVQHALLQLLDSPVASFSAKEKYRAYVQRGTESILGKFLNASQDALYPLDRFSLGRGLLEVYIDDVDRQTVKEGLDVLNESIALQPRNQYGGLWYFTYPNWSYLDGMYSYTSFASLYTTHFNPGATPETTHDIIDQLDLLWSHCFDNTTDFLFHGYDASKTAVWANPITGASPIVWGRAMGWYFMALINWLELNYFLQLEESLQWRYVQSRFVSLANALVRAADPVSGAWLQVLNHPGREGNYIESSGSAMFVYGLYKGVRLDYLPQQQKYRETADKAYEYLARMFVVNNENGTLSWNGTVSVCSLNSTADYQYYVMQPLLFDSVHGSASFVLASLENEIQARL
ncbi:hypothetical protein TMatcc_007223 [Talaromyces marneffei ATCC 18224]|uniref:Cell wall glycosyl hydrolase YteR, putative n=1 Tax=Talaromyces marneffei (strain ATCC 18224 / CBS 334.59 / QM 7333) TaxID=441960 RepID=B6QFB1_TALMQ|nr:uncharacterized protein EYB26_004201 [Talaromyces marneffei]EEA24146.1 cell wall glycosyl hydrolase YteR, putative [Talaromyces marneffei ATCC 18224]QGA16534.1 hypothetical protein EYB26_004201 [Talaromyces marneffei]